MDRYIEDLIETLEQTKQLYKQLLPLIDREKQAAVGSDVQRLTLASNEKQIIIAQINRLDRSLKHIMHDIARIRRISHADLNLRKICEWAEAPYKHQLLQLNDELGHLVAQVQTANQECRDLIQHCLRLVQNTLGFFQHWMGNAQTYGAKGSRSKEAFKGGRLLSGTV